MASGIYDVDGLTRLTASPGSGFCGRYAPDGSFYYTLAPGSGFCGSTAPDGSLYVVDATGSPATGSYASNGALRVTSNKTEFNGALRVSGILGALASWDASTSTLAQLTALASVSRPSLATMFDSTGKLTYAPNNLLTYSNTFSDAAWTKSSMSVASGATDPFGTALAWTLTATGPGALLYQLQSLAGPNAIPYVWMRRKTGSGIIYLRNANNVSIDVTAQVSSSWALVYAAPTAALGSNLFLISLATNGDQIEIYSAGYSAVTYETTPRLQDRISTGASAYYGPRIDYDPNTLAVKGLLIEEARTNAISASNDLSSVAWAKNGTTVTINSATGPDGQTSLAQVNKTTSFNGQLYRNYSTANTKTVSFYASKGSLNYVAVSMYSSIGSAFFNLNTGAVAATNNGTATVTASIVAVGGGIYRCIAVFSGTYTPAELHIEPSDGTNTTQLSPWGSGGTGTINLGFIQVEEGVSFATSYIPTVAASVTRAADALTAASLTTYPAIIQKRDLATGVRSRVVINPWSGVSSEVDEWIEAIRIYPLGTTGAYLNTKLTVDGPW